VQGTKKNGGTVGKNYFFDHKQKAAKPHQSHILI